MSSEDQVWKLAPGVRFRRLLDEAVLISPDHAEAFALNDTAASFVERLDGLRTTGEIVASMTREFDISAEELLADLSPLITTLTKKSIIQEKNQDPKDC